MTTPNPIPELPRVGGRYGAPMGRRSDAPCDMAPPATPFDVRRVTLDSGGYDAGGAYWGTGEPLYIATATHADGDAVTVYRRAVNRDHMESQLRADYPGCEIAPPVADMDDSTDTLSDFVAGFFEALIFAECAPGVYWHEWNDLAAQAERDGDYLCDVTGGEIPDGCDVDDFSPDSIRRAKEFCAAFQAHAADLLAPAYARPDYDEAQAGRDLYFTYAGHGVGFWDRKPLDAGGLGDDLSDAAGRGEFMLWIKVAPDADGMGGVIGLEIG